MKNSKTISKLLLVALLTSQTMLGAGNSGNSFWSSITSPLFDGFSSFCTSISKRIFMKPKNVKLGAAVLGLAGLGAAVYGITYWLSSPSNINKEQEEKKKSDNKLNENVKLPVFKREMSFSEWKDACSNPLDSILLTKEVYTEATENYLKILQNQPFGDPNCWISGTAPDCFQIQTDENFEDIFFVQKYMTNSNIKFAIHADIHGDIKSTVKYVDKYVDDNFEIKDKNLCMVFCGDYTDRGNYGVEVLYTLMRLKTANPDRVFLLRGNHEDFTINESPWCGGFMNEIMSKFKIKINEAKKLVNSLYKTFSAALFLGCKKTKDGLLLCHAGIEAGFNPKKLLSDPRDILYEKIERLDTKWINSECYETVKYPTYNLFTNSAGTNANENPGEPALGFTWSDFNNSGYYFYPNRGNSFGEKCTQKYLKACSFENFFKLNCIIRGHQHYLKDNNGQNYGLCGYYTDTKYSGKQGEKIKPTEGSVWTLNASPGSVYGPRFGYGYDTHVLLELNNGEFKNWTLEPRNIEIP